MNGLFQHLIDGYPKYYIVHLLLLADAALLPRYSAFPDIFTFNIFRRPSSFTRRTPA